MRACFTALVLIVHSKLRVSQQHEKRDSEPHSTAFGQHSVNSRLTVVGLLVVGIVAVGCEQTTEPIESHLCIPEIDPALEVQVRDARTGLPLAATATAIATRTNSFQLRAYTDTLKVKRLDSAGTPISLAGIYREGKYSVVITHEGYKTWIAEDVQVVRGHCGPVSLPLSAFLLRQ